METTVLLPQSLNINAVGELLKRFKEEISKSQCIILDAKDVQEIDGLGLQLILSLEKTASMNGLSLKLINAQDKLKDILAAGMNL